MIGSPRAPIHALVRGDGSPLRMPMCCLVLSVSVPDTDSFTLGTSSMSSWTFRSHLMRYSETPGECVGLCDSPVRLLWTGKREMKNVQPRLTECRHVWHLPQRLQGPGCAPSYPILYKTVVSQTVPCLKRLHFTSSF